MLRGIIHSLFQDQDSAAGTEPSEVKTEPRAEHSEIQPGLSILLLLDVLRI